MVADTVLRELALLPTARLVERPQAFWLSLTDADVMRVAVLLAQKSFDEGGCPIGAVIIDRATRRIVGKGHNRLVQDNDPTTHGETAAIRDAGRLDFSRTLLFTSLSPCDVCCALLINRGFRQVMIGDAVHGSGNEQKLRDHGITVRVLEDPLGIALYRRYRATRPDLDQEDWRGLAAGAAKPHD
jgi:cytosine deaminase